MFVISPRRWALLLVVLLGCSSPTRRDQNTESTTPIVGRGKMAPSKPLAIGDRPTGSGRQNDDFEDRTLLIPPPPRLDELTKQPPRNVRPSDSTTVKQVQATDIVVPNDSPKPRPASLVAIKGESGGPTPIRKEPAADRVDDESLAAITRLHQRAVASNAKMDAFEARLTRRETIGGKANPQEVIRFQFRKQPYSVHLVWIGTEGKGREVVYVQKSPTSKMNILPTKQDSFPLPPMRMTFAPEDSVVRSKTRHDIRDAGMGESVKHLGIVLAAINGNPTQRHRLKYLGPIQRPEYVNKLDVVEETIAPRSESLLPQGGKRVYFFDIDPQSVSFGLPVLNVTRDTNGREVEYYCFDRFLFPIRFKDSDFDPEMMGKK